MASEFF